MSLEIVVPDQESVTRMHARPFYRWHVPCLAMRMSRTIQQWFTTLALVFAASALCSAFALTIGDSRDLGLISKNQPADPSSSAGFIDILLSQLLNSGPTPIGANTYTRTGNDPLGGDYSNATYSGVEFGANVTNINLGSGYQYLFGKVRWTEIGAAKIWYVGGLTGAITIPLYGSGDKFEVSHTYLYNPTVYVNSRWRNDRSNARFIFVRAWRCEWLVRAQGISALNILRVRRLLILGKFQSPVASGYARCTHQELAGSEEWLRGRIRSGRRSKTPTSRGRALRRKPNSAWIRLPGL